jgi:hypothetical protein
VPIYFPELPFFDDTEFEEEDWEEEDWEDEDWEEEDWEEEDWEEEDEDWKEFRRAFFGAGIVFLSDKLHSKKGKIIASLITYLTVLHPIGELHLFLNNWVSGCLRTAFTVHDGIQQLPRPGHNYFYKGGYYG